jgi:hypothetical protein
MLTQNRRFIEKYGIAIGVLVGFGILVLVAGPATAQDLSDGVSSATGMGRTSAFIFCLWCWGRSARLP